VKVSIFAVPQNLTLEDASNDVGESCVKSIGDRVTLFAAAAVSSCNFVASTWIFMSRDSLPFCDVSLGAGFTTLAPTVLGGSGDNVEGADFLATEILSFVAGMEELRGMPGRVLRLRDLAGVEDVEAGDDALGEDFFLRGGVAVSSSGSRACLREAG
jgi:hypothetical protein